MSDNERPRTRTSVPRSAASPGCSGSEAGGLFSYGTDNADLFRRVPTYVDRIFKGDTPAQLPVQLPTKFEFVINLKTAKALGIEVPAKLRTFADEVIE